METVVFHIDRSPAFHQELNDIDVWAPTRQMQARVTILVARQWIDAAVE